MRERWKIVSSRYLDFLEGGVAPSHVIKKALNRGISLRRGPVGGAGGEVRLPGTSGDSKRRLCQWTVSLWGLCEGNMERGLLYWGPWRIYKGKLWRREEKLFFPGNSRNSKRGICEGTLEGGLFSWGSWRICKEGLLTQVSFSVGIPLGDRGGEAALSGNLRESWYFDLSGGLV